MAWRGPAYYCLAEIAAARGDQAAALDFTERALEANALNVRALGLKASLLRLRGRPEDALAVVTEAFRRTDPLDVRLMAERWLASGSAEARRELVDVMRAHPATALETAAEYANAGLWSEGARLLSELEASEKGKVSPLVYYYLGYFAEKLGQTDQAGRYYALAERAPPDYVFPFQHEVIDILGRAMERNPRDARAPYYLGNLLYDWQPERAVQLWEKSAALDGSFPIVLRNLGIAYARAARGSDLKRAIAWLEKAISLPQKHALHFAELDALYEAAGLDPEKRLAVLERNHDVVAERDDALAREITLKVVLGKYDEAIRLMSGRRFSVWEGGSLRVADDWTDAHLLRGHQHRAAGRYREALRDYETALAVPDNLPAERRFGESREAEIHYWIGLAWEALGESSKAREHWHKAAAADSRPARAGSPLAVQSYYRARALEKLGQTQQARQIYEELVRSATQTLQQTSGEIDFFASFGEQQSQRSRLAGAHYLKGLGHLGLAETDKARQEFEAAVRYMPDHLGARTQLAELRR
jgi:tetratricopeptide (TPR) repeat protein